MYALRVLIALDQLLNAVLMGYPDETLSARSYRLKDTSCMWRLSNKVINTLFFFQSHHTQAAYTSEQNHDDLPEGEK